MKIIVINGQGGVGKDTFVGYCGYEDEGIYNVSMVDGIKDVAETLGWLGGKELKDRKFLSDLKDLASEYSDFPFQSTVSRIKQITNVNKWLDPTVTKNLIFFVHAREPKDIQRWVDDYGAHTLLIRRSDVEGDYGNHADNDVFNIDYNYIIQNDGDLYHLKEMAETFIETIKKEDWESTLWKK